MRTPRRRRGDRLKSKVADWIAAHIEAKSANGEGGALAKDARLAMLDEARADPAAWDIPQLGMRGLEFLFNEIYRGFGRARDVFEPDADPADGGATDEDGEPPQLELELSIGGVPVPRVLRYLDAHLGKIRTIDVSFAEIRHYALAIEWKRVKAKQDLDRIAADEQVLRNMLTRASGNDRTRILDVRDEPLAGAA